VPGDLISKALGPLTRPNNGHDLSYYPEERQGVQRLKLGPGPGIGRQEFSEAVLEL